MTFEELQKRFDGPVMRPFFVAYGMGVDSTSALVELVRRFKSGARECRPEVILFADTGGEKIETMQYENVIQEYLSQNGFPPIITVRYKSKRYSSLEENCLKNGTLPSLAFGFSSCSQKFKRQPQDKFAKAYSPAIDCWSRGMSCIKLIGYDGGTKDARRSKIADDAKWSYWYPLRDELHWDRERCIEEIRREGLPVPMKSSCFFCPAMKPDEVESLCRTHPEYAKRIIQMEANAAPRNKKIEGLWRKKTKKRPGSMTEFILSKGLIHPLEAEQAASQSFVDLPLKEARPVESKSQLEFAWQDQPDVALPCSW